MSHSLLRAVCFGDSITGACPGEAYHDSYLKFSDLLQLMLEARLGIGQAVVLNRGFAGQTSSEALARFQKDVLDEDPDIAIILIAGNDTANPHVSTEQTCTNLQTMFADAREAGIQVLALQYHFLPGDGAEPGWYWLDDNNSLIAEAARALSIPTLDMTPVLLQAAMLSPREELVDSQDGVHLRPGGELVYARAIFSRLDELNWL